MHQCAEVSRTDCRRLESLEGQVGGINRKLDDISSFLQGMARNQQQTPATTDMSPLTTYTHASKPSRLLLQVNTSRVTSTLSDVPR